MKKHLLPLIVMIFSLLCSNSIGAQSADSSKLNKIENRLEKRERKDEKLHRKSQKNQKKLNRQERKLRKEQRKLRKRQRRMEQEGIGSQSASRLKMQERFSHAALYTAWAFEEVGSCARHQNYIKRTAG